MISQKWHLALRTAPIVFAALAIKALVHFYGFEFFSLSPLIGAIISANVFIIGFLISGVLVDYKESERLPNELACSLEAIADESMIVYQNKKSPEAAALTRDVSALLAAILDWFHREERTKKIMHMVSDLSAHFLAFEGLTQANFIARLKQEQSTLRRIVMRIDMIRDTSFNSSGYAIAEIMSTVLCVGLIFTKIEPYYESMFFVAFVSFILIYMVFLIKSLDNPFSHYERKIWVDNVSLKPLRDLAERLRERTGETKQYQRP